MKKLFYIFLAFISLSVVSTSCSKSTQTYADLVDYEENVINHLLNYQNIKTITLSEEDINSWTKSILNDSVSPSDFIELGQWYEITEGNFKRLCFRINDWGDGYQKSVVEHATSFYDDKFVKGSYSVVRFDSLYQMTDSLDFDTQTPINNYEPYKYQIIYNWNESYYSSSYYSYYYGSGSSYECTSGGLAFPLRFLWDGGEASLIVPFSLVPTEYQSYYYTLYYGKVKYTKPTYIPE